MLLLPLSVVVASMLVITPFAWDQPLALSVVVVTTSAVAALFSVGAILDRRLGWVVAGAGAILGGSVFVLSQSIPSVALHATCAYLFMFAGIHPEVRQVPVSVAQQPSRPAHSQPIPKAA